MPILNAQQKAVAQAPAFDSVPSLQHWSAMMRDGVPIDSVRAAFDASWGADAVVPRGKGFKPFNRWYWQAAPRVDASGIFEQSDVWERALVAAREDGQAEEFNRSASSGDAWSFVGHDTPDGLGGCGRINRVMARPGMQDQWWACAPAGGLWRSDNAGETWATAGTDGLASIGISDIAFHPSDPEVMYLATGDGDYADTRSIGVLKSVDGGASWDATGLSWSTYMGRTISRLLVHPTHPDTVLAASSLGVYRSDDGGENWVRTLTGDYASLEFKPGEADVVLAGSFGNFVSRSFDGGVTWNTFSINGNDFGISRIALAFAPGAPDTAYAITGTMSGQGFDGFYRSTDAGVTWDLQADSPNLLGWTVAGTDPSGQAWYDLCIAVDPNDADRVWTGGVNLWSSQDGGSTWSCAGHWYGGSGLPRLHADQHSLQVLDDGSLLIGNDGGVASFDPNMGEAGASTDHSAGLAITQIYRASSDPESTDRVLIGTQDNGTFMRNDGNWSHVLDGDGFECHFHPSDPDVMYTSLYYGQIFRSDDGGNAFVEIAGNSGAGAHSQSAWLTPFVTSAFQPDELYLGKNTVYHSTDRGESWEMLGNIPGSNITELAVSASDPNTIYAVKERILYKSTDGVNFNLVSAGNGYSWIKKVLIDPSDAQHVWLALSNYSDTTKVLETTDGGLNWASRSSGLPPAPVNDLVSGFGAEGELLAATDVGIYHTTDGQNWTQYSTGLPTVWVTDLIVNEGTGKIYAATYGRGMYVSDFPEQPGLDAALGRVISPRGTICGDMVNFTVPVFNRGTTAITSLSVNYGIFAGASGDTVWTGEIAPGNSIHLQLAPLQNATGQGDALILLTEINGGVDEVAANNARSPHFSSVADEDIELLVVRFQNNCFGAQNGWTITNGIGDIIAHSTWIAPLVERWDTVCLAEGCYQFHLHRDQLSGYEALSSDCDTQLDFDLRLPGGDVFLGATITDAVGVYPFCVPDVNDGGCIDPVASNFDADAIFDDGSCAPTCYPLELTIETDCNGHEIGWTLTDASGLSQFGIAPGTLQSQTMYSWPMCQLSGCWNIELVDGGGDGLTGCADEGGASSGAHVLLTAGDDTLYYGQAENFGSSLGLMACLPHPLVYGCMDPTGCDFNPEANTPGDCGHSCYGCNDPVACNYNPGATTGDGSCLYPTGCTDPTACQYDLFAVCDDGSCSYAQLGYNCAGACLGTDSDGDGICDAYEVAGCMDAEACNYNAAATDEAVCLWEEFWYPDADGDGFGDSDGLLVVCAPPGGGYVMIGGDCNDANNIIYPGAPVLPLNEDVNCDGYVASYELDPCAPDLNGDTFTAIEDLLNLLSEFGCTSLCLHDIDGNGAVTSSDLLVLLAAYGSSCIGP
jgi:hypothetical protein